MVAGGGVGRSGFASIWIRARSRFRLRDILINFTILFATLGVCEMILRVIDLRELRDGYRTGYPVVFRYDEELGWSPIPNSVAEFHGSRTIEVRHNSLGLRDVEHDATPRPTILFIGDSFAWGYDVQTKERFTELLRKDLPGVRIVNAGVVGYGTDQEYLLLKRIWSVIKPDAVVLMFTVDNDRADNTSNSRSDGYLKPYLEKDAGGAWHFAGYPVPWSRYVYFQHDRVVKNLWLARAVTTAYTYIRHPKIDVPDPTERLVGMMQAFVEAQGATFLVGLQEHEPQLEAFLRAKKIRFVAFDGAERFQADGGHWNQIGHMQVAEELLSLFTTTGGPGLGQSRPTPSTAAVVGQAASRN